MNILKIFALILCLSFISCHEVGKTSNVLTGQEQSLPNELKGLKIYNVSLGNDGYVKVAILDNNVMSLTESHNDETKSLLILNKNKIKVKEILIENDSIIVCRK
jgi:hypothetical protein